MQYLTRGILVLVFLLAAAGCARFQPVYLTWQGDPSTTMTVNIQTPPETRHVRVHYDTVSRAGEPEAYAAAAECTWWQVPGVRDGRRVHSAELTGLAPGERYYFVLEDGGQALTEELSFRTIPEDPQTLRFVSGGDMGPWGRARRLLEHAAATDPMFGIVGGDIAYANGNVRKVGRWDGWLENWCEVMVTREGCLVPIVAAVGNHEVNGEVEADGDSWLRAPFFFGFLPQGGESYFSRRFGKDTVVHVLDSGHVADFGGEQAAWLEETLAATADRPHQFAVYHVPMFPSHRSFEDRRSEMERALWMPLFDQYGLDIGFENHDHTLKRTLPLKGGEVAPDGTVYLGDGSFGVWPRKPDPDGRWYLEHASGDPHFWSVAVTGGRIACEAVGQDGRILDRYERE